MILDACVVWSLASDRCVKYNKFKFVKRYDNKKFLQGDFSRQFYKNN